MKRKKQTPARLLAFLSMSVFLSAAFAEVAISDDELLSLAQHRADKMARVTDSPQVMIGTVAANCAANVTGTYIPVNPVSITLQKSSVSAVITATSSPPAKFYQIYITNPGLDIIRSGKGSYPEGTVVLKEKFSGAQGQITELFTAMVKRRKGFNPDGGDWEYFVLSADAKKIVQRGKIESCMNCHDSYQSTDYVTRRYVSDHP